MSQPTPPAPPPDAASPLSLLDPRALAAVSRMELVARQVMDGYVQGVHRSPHVGFALDFAQHRQYVPGDDIKRIDWRVYAKADRYYIKQYEVTTNLRAHLVVDASGSIWSIIGTAAATVPTAAAAAVATKRKSRREPVAALVVIANSPDSQPYALVK